MNIPLANYDEPRRSINALFQTPCSEHILLLRGLSGSGKSSLVDYCLDHAPSEMIKIHFDFKSGAFNVPELLDQISERLGRQKMQTFYRQFVEYGALPIDVRENHQLGWNNQMEVRQYVMGDREQQRTGLTRSWFDDINRLQSPMLLAFDTYEKASFDVREWFSSAFLSRAARCPQLRIMVAGQEVPDLSSRELKLCSRQHNLDGVKEEKHWLPVVKALGLQYDPTALMVGLCTHLKGHPGEIMKTLQEIQRQELQRRESL